MSTAYSNSRPSITAQALDPSEYKAWFLTEPKRGSLPLTVTLDGPGIDRSTVLYPHAGDAAGGFSEYADESWFDEVARDRERRRRRVYLGVRPGNDGGWLSGSHNIQSLSVSPSPRPQAAASSSQRPACNPAQSVYTTTALSRGSTPSGLQVMPTAQASYGLPANFALRPDIIDRRIAEVDDFSPPHTSQATDRDEFDHVSQLEFYDRFNQESDWKEGEIPYWITDAIGGPPERTCYKERSFRAIARACKDYGALASLHNAFKENKTVKVHWCQDPRGDRLFIGRPILVDKSGHAEKYPGTVSIFYPSGPTGSRQSFQRLLLRSLVGNDGLTSLFGSNARKLLEAQAYGVLDVTHTERVRDETVRPPEERSEQHSTHVLLAKGAVTRRNDQIADIMQGLAFDSAPTHSNVHMSWNEFIAKVTALDPSYPPPANGEPSKRDPKTPMISDMED